MCAAAAVRCSVFRSASALANTFLKSERKDKKEKGKGKGKEAGQPLASAAKRHRADKDSLATWICKRAKAAWASCLC